MTISMTTAVRNARADALTTAIGNAALLRIYDGTPPANANAALSGNTKLAELTCGSPFAPAAASGVQTANSITQDSSADATGTASFFRVYKSDGTTVTEQGSVGTSGADLNLNTTSIVAGGPVAVTSFALTEGNP
jgi:hypothetical protein